MENYNFSSPLSGKRLPLFCFFSSEMCLGMDHVMEVSSYVSWGKVSVLEAGVMFVFVGVCLFVCLVGFCVVWFCEVFFPLGFFLGFETEKEMIIF